MTRVSLKAQAYVYIFFLSPPNLENSFFSRLSESEERK